MITVGSVDRETAARWLDFLAESFRSRRKAIRSLTHGFPEFVFWIYPEGGLHDARTSHKAHPPPGFSHILDDEPDYCGFLRGRVVRYALVISDNADIYGTMEDLWQRQAGGETFSPPQT